MSDRWPPTTLAELQRAVANGLLAESHFVDIKRELPPPPKNERLAIDLAAFSVDGGVIFVGVDEADGHVLVSPTPLEGLAERVEQIGLASVDSPVRITTHAIGVEDRQGVLVIVIPPSPRAPHMVDGRYRGRGDRTNLVLGDAEVIRIRAEVRRHREDAIQILHDWLPNAVRGRRESGSLLAVVGCPSVSRQDMLLRAWQQDPRHWIHETLLRGPLTAWLGERFSPDFYDSLTVAPRANGWGIAHGGTDRSELELEIHEDGTLRLRAEDLDIVNQDGRTYVNDVAVNGLVRRLILSAGTVGSKSSYLGSWDFAVVVESLRGKFALSAAPTGWTRSVTAYSEDDYEANSSATLEEIQADPDTIHRLLLGRLNRSFAGINDLVLK
jgi:hypothetical protein